MKIYWIAMAHRSILLLLAAGMLTVGCGDDEGPRTVTRRDAGRDEDASVRDSGTPVIDANVEDTGTPEQGLEGACAIDSNKIFSVWQRAEPFAGTPLSVDPIASKFALPFIGLQGGCLDVVNLTMLEGGSADGGPTTKVAIDTCALIRETAATAVQSQWFVATIDNRMPPFDVWVQRYDAALGEQGAATRLSAAAAVETTLAIATLRDNNHAIVAWGDESSEGNALYTRVLDVNAENAGEAVRIEQSTTLVYRGLSLAPLGMQGAALAYWRYSADFSTSEIVFRALDAAGKPTRAEWVLATKAGPAASVDVATDSTTGGIVWARAEGTQRQVWFQRIDDTGQAAELLTTAGRSPMQRLVNTPFKGIDVALAKLRAGYIVAYRALPAVNETRAAIRLYFLDRAGAVVGDSDVSYTSESGGRTAVETAYDGRTVVGWSQVNSDGKSELKLVRLPCIGG